MFSNIPFYDWGSLTLATLYSSLDAFSRCCRQTFTGATYLLEVSLNLHIFLSYIRIFLMRLFFIATSCLWKMWFYEVIGCNTQLIALKDETVGDSCRLYRWRKANRQSKGSLSLEEVRQVLNGLTNDRVRLFSFSVLVFACSDSVLTYACLGIFR